MSVCGGKYIGEKGSVDGMSSSLYPNASMSGRR